LLLQYEMRETLTGNHRGGRHSVCRFKLTSHSEVLEDAATKKRGALLTQ